MINRRTVGDIDAPLRRIGRAVDCLRAQSGWVRPQDHHDVTEARVFVRATPLSWPQLPSELATDAVRKVSLSQELGWPTPLVYAWPTSGPKYLVAGLPSAAA